MAKLTATQKMAFKSAKVHMNTTQGNDFAFLINREYGISALAWFTGPYKNHHKIVISYCGPDDDFKKKIGFTECVNKKVNNEGVLIKSCGVDIWTELYSFCGNLDMEMGTH